MSSSSEADISSEVEVSYNSRPLRGVRTRGSYHTNIDEYLPIPDIARPAIHLLKTAGLTRKIDIDVSKVNYDVYRCKEWRSEHEDSGKRRDLSAFLANRANTKGQAAIDKLWIEGWEQEAKYWPEEQADAYCIFAVTKISDKQLRLIANFYWFRTPMLHTPAWFYFVHVWLWAKHSGISSPCRKFWFPHWSERYNINAIAAERDPRWSAAAEGFYQPCGSSSPRPPKTIDYQPTTNLRFTVETPSEPHESHLSTALQHPVARDDDNSFFSDRSFNSSHYNDQSFNSTQGNDQTLDTTVQSDESLRDMTEEAFDLLNQMQATRLDDPALANLTEENYQRKRMRLHAHIELLQSQVRALDQAHNFEENKKSARRFLELVTKKRLGEEVDETEFQWLLAIVRAGRAAATRSGQDVQMQG